MSWIGPVISRTGLLLRTLGTKTVRLMKSSLRERCSGEFSFLHFTSITGYYKSTLLPFLPFSILPPPSFLISADISICKNSTEISPSPSPLLYVSVCCCWVYTLGSQTFSAPVVPLNHTSSPKNAFSCAHMDARHSRMPGHVLAHVYSHVHGDLRLLLSHLFTSTRSLIRTQGSPVQLTSLGSPCRTPSPPCSRSHHVRVLGIAHFISCASSLAPLFTEKSTKPDQLHRMIFLRQGSYHGF